MKIETLPNTAVTGICPYCEVGVLIIDEPSSRTWHENPPCARYLELCKNATPLGLSEFENLKVRTLQCKSTS